MIALTYFQAAVALAVVAWIGAALGVFAIAICSYPNACTGDCNQGRNCTCKRSCHA